MPPVKKVRPGQPLRIPASDYNAMADAANEIARLRGQMTVGTLGLRIAEIWLGRIVGKGPEEEADYTDARYWVRRVVCTNTEGDSTSNLSFADGFVTPYVEDDWTGIWVTATNIAEWQAGSHLLSVVTDPPSDPADSPLVVMYTVYDKQASAIKRYWFYHAPRVIATELFVVRVWQDGGTTDGDYNTQCDRTYTACTLSATAPDGTGGEQLGTGLTPVRKRPAYGKLVTPPASGAGEIGVGYYSEVDSQFYLWDAGEIEDVFRCDEV